MSDPLPVPGELLEIVEALVPGTRLDRARFVRGGVHDVVLLPGVAAVRVSRRPSGARAPPRRTELLRLVAAAGLPFAVPEPLTPVTMFGERAAVAVSWLDGAGLPAGVGDPGRIGELLGGLRELAVTPELRVVLGAPRTYTGGHHWANLRQAVDSATCRRAQVWDRALGVTHLVAALDGKPRYVPPGWARFQAGESG